MDQDQPHETDRWVGVLLAEYHALYKLAEFRMGALDRRVPGAGAAIVAFLSGVPALPEASGFVLLLAIPISIVWFVRTTVNHARSFEDLLRRIEQIELTINFVCESELMRFQSSHPSRGRAVGGRTGFETVSAVGLASAIMLGACEMLMQSIGPGTVWVSLLYTNLLMVVAAYVLVYFWIWRKYKYPMIDPLPK